MTRFIARSAGTTATVRVAPFGSHEGCHPGTVLCCPLLRAELTTQNVSPLENAFEIDFDDGLALELRFLHRVPPRAHRNRQTDTTVQKPHLMGTEPYLSRPARDFVTPSPDHPIRGQCHVCLRDVASVCRSKASDTPNIFFPFALVPW